jgi:hypothetical protein
MYAEFARGVVAQEAILGHLLGALRLDALLSADAILALLPALARDLGPDFVPLFPRFLDTLAALLDAGTAGLWWGRGERQGGGREAREGGGRGREGGGCPPVVTRGRNAVSIKHLTVLTV